jgi:hypothetical protein
MINQGTLVGEPKQKSATRPPLPPFTRETAIQKIRLAEDAWNTRDPERWHWRTRPIRSGETAPNSREDERQSFNF